MSDTDTILVRLEALDDRQDERHQEITRRLEKLESTVTKSEAWRNQQIGQGRAIGVAVSAFVSVAMTTFWNFLTGRS
jgi:tetrahydromethanopterin S-methyltransferase subunit G